MPSVMIASRKDKGGQKRIVAKTRSQTERIFDNRYKNRAKSEVDGLDDSDLFTDSNAAYPHPEAFENKKEAADNG